MKTAKNKKEHSEKEDAFIKRIVEFFISSIKNLPPVERKRRKIHLPTSNGFSIYFTDEIIYCAAADHFTVCYFIDKSEVVVCLDLKEVLELLPPAEFMRIHVSHVINLNMIMRYIKGDGGIVIMSNGNELNVARSHKPELLKRLKENAC